MKFLIGTACAFAIAASGVYLVQTSRVRAAQKRSAQYAAAELCLHKKIEAAEYHGSLDYTGAHIVYATADAYCN